MTELSNTDAARCIYILQAHTQMISGCFTQHANQMQPTILTAEGTYFDFLHPYESAWEITIETVAHALSNVCRFGGHCKEFYSVAQHCVILSHIVPREHALQGLMHEAGEPFCGDMPAPLKMLLPEFKAIEKRIERAVLARFGLPEELHPSIKAADLVMLRTEQRDMMGADSHVWTNMDGVVPLPHTIHAWPAKAAKQMFIARWRELGGEALLSARG